MLLFFSFLIAVLIGGLLTLMVYGVLNSIRRKSIPVTVATSNESLIKQEPILSDVPKRSVANSHWFKHTFERPRK